MSKLDGNERWKSKMLLTEHAEQYDRSHQDGERRVMTIEERTMVRDYILLPHMEKMVQKSITDLEYSSNLLKRLYLSAGHAVMSMMTRDLYRLRRELKKRNIRVVAEEQSDVVVYHRCYCRGYEESFGMTREVMRSEIGVQLTRYTSELSSLLREQAKNGR